MAEEPSPLARQLYRLAGDVARLTDKVEALGTAADDVAALRHRVHALPPGEDLKAVLGEVGGTLKDVSARLEALESAVNGREETPKVWNWLTMSEDQQAAAWDTLRQWVADVLDGVYGVIADPTGQKNELSQSIPKIPACWPQHHDLLWELSWLCQEWLRIYTTADGRPAAAGDWHDRYLQGLRRRLASTTISRCIDRGHKEREYGGVVAR